MLNDTILKKLSSNKYSAIKLSEFSRKSGIKEGALFQILKGIIKNPGVYTIAKIADALDCSVDELIADNSAGKQTELKVQLARSCITVTIDLLRQEKYKVSLDEFLYILKEVYIYSLNKKAKAIDTKFATQYINDFLKSKDAER